MMTSFGLNCDERDFLSFTGQRVIKPDASEARGLAGSERLKVCTDNWIGFAVGYIRDYKARRSTKNRLFSLILEEFEKTGGRVKIASTTIQLVDPQPLTVKLSGKLPE